MNPVAREFKYEAQNGTPRLTPKQGRRVRHKYGSRKTHSHEDLLMLVSEDGSVRRQRCSRCCPAGKPRAAVGGTR